MKLKYQLALALYSAMMWLIQPLLRRKLLRRSRKEPLYAQFIAERFGDYSDVKTQLASQLKPLVWVHAVSLGETRAVAVLIEELRSLIPGMRLLLTHGTATGRAQGLTMLRDGDVQVWQPWDTKAATLSFVRQFRPRIGLLVETEIWPNLIASCKSEQVPLCLVNARLSEKSLQKALRLSWLAIPAYSSLKTVWVQSNSDADRLKMLGANVDGVIGNFKFDTTPEERMLSLGKSWRTGRQIVLFASSREGEEQALLDLLLANRSLVSSVQWLIVPRHPQRFDEVHGLFERAGFKVSRRSHWGDFPRDADVWLGDSLGEMVAYYALADVALLGGSFEPLGGQNLIEAAACTCPVVMGPHTFNFAEAANLAVQAGAAFSVDNLRDAVDFCLRLLGDQQLLFSARKAATELSTAHRGAALRTAHEIVRMMRSGSRG